MYAANRRAATSIIYVEFGWNVDIQVARQVVQERLTTLAGQLPAEIRPRMMPTSSIMGQIMYVGLYRQPAPRGGELAAVGKTGLWAEWNRANTPAKLFLWKIEDRKRPES